LEGGERKRKHTQTHTDIHRKKNHHPGAREVAGICGLVGLGCCLKRIWPDWFTFWIVCDRILF